MTERRDPFDDRLRAALDDVPAPDLWDAATDRERPERPLPSGPSPGRRVAIAAFALLIFAGATTFLLLAGGGGLGTVAAPTKRPTASAEPASVSMMLKETPGIRCTATIPSVVQPGEKLGPTYTLENVSDGTVKVSLVAYGFPVRVEAGNGATWDTADLMNHSWPPVLPTPLAAGASTTMESETLAVQFPGPLTVAPTCAGERMPQLHVTVADPGATPTPDEAVTRAIGAASGLFDRCPPPANGSTVGTITPPDDPSLTLEDVRCSTEVATFPGFAVVTFVITTPSSGSEPSVPLGILLPLDLPTKDGNAETVAWRFVVTATDVSPVAGATHSRTVDADAMATAYEVSTTGWSTGGSSRCGGEGFSSGGDGSSAYVEFFNACR